jgi:predicted lactoylglutathione lyase
MYKSITPNLMVENVAETIAFYEGLGFATTATVPKESGGFQFAIMVKDNLMLMFQDRESLIGEYPLLQTAKTQPSITLYIVVDNVKKYYDDMKARYELQAELHKTF